MSTLALLADPTVHTVAAAHLQVAASQIRADGLSSWANSAITSWTTVVKGAALLVGIVLFVVTAVKTKLSVASMIVAGLMSGFLIWAVTMNGLGWFSTGIGGETNQGLAPASLSQEL